MASVEPACIRITSLAKRWDCSATKIRGLIKDGTLPHIRLGKMVRVPLVAVIAHEAQCLTRTVPASSASPAAVPGTSTTGGVASLRDLRIARRLSGH